MLKITFENAALRYSDDEALMEDCWHEIEDHYLKDNRYYHNLTHIIYLIDQLKVISETIGNWDAVIFAAFYHDIIYKAVRKNNEEKSAMLAGKRLEQLGVDEHTTQLCQAMIRATSTHQIHAEHDVNLFTDADLSILGSDSTHYKDYTQQVRKEYAMYPDMLYKPGRRKVLDHFLSMDRIFKTDHFYNRLEGKARKNMAEELESL